MRHEEGRPTIQSIQSFFPVCTSCLFLKLMAMALSLGGGGRRRWSCRPARRGNGWAGCRHFHVHVHYHVPCQVWAFSPPRLPCLLILPVLFLAVLAFLVCFGWLTLVYVASSLWSRSVDPASDANEFAGEDEREEERPVKLVTEHDGHSGVSEVCVEGKEIREVEDGFSDESRYISRMASSGIFITNNEEKIVKEVTMLERKLKGSKAFAELDGSSEKHDQLVLDIPVDCFLEEPKTEEFSTSINDDTMKLLDVLSAGHVFDANTKEISVLGSTEIRKFIDKHDTAQMPVKGAGTDFVIPEITSSDDSTTHVLGDKYTTEIKQEHSLAELSVDTVPEKLPADVTDEWQETQTLVIELNNKQPEAASNEEYRKQIVGISDESQDSACEMAACEMAGLPLDSVSENISENEAASNTPFNQTNSDKDIELQEDLIQNKRVESSTSASAICDFANNHLQMIEELDGLPNEENVPEEGPSVLETVHDEDIDNHVSMGVPRRLPLVRRSQHRGGIYVEFLMCLQEKTKLRFTDVVRVLTGVLGLIKKKSKKLMLITFYRQYSSGIQGFIYLYLRSFTIVCNDFGHLFFIYVPSFWKL